MATDNAILLCFIALFALSLPIKASTPVFFDETQRSLFGGIQQENIQKLQDITETAISAALETIKNGVNSVDNYITKLATKQWPKTANKIFDYTKRLVGLKSDLEKKNIKTNVCMIDTTIEKLDTVPNDVGRQVQICKKTIALQIEKYIDRAYDHFKAANAEVAQLVKAGVKCIQSFTLECIGDIGVSIGSAIFRIPTEVSKQVSDTLSLLNSFQERGVICVTSAIERTIKKAKSYKEQTEKCLKERYSIQ